MGDLSLKIAVMSANSSVSAGLAEKFEHDHVSLFYPGQNCAYINRKHVAAGNTQAKVDVNYNIWKTNFQFDNPQNALALRSPDAIMLVVDLTEDEWDRHADQLIQIINQQNYGPEVKIVIVGTNGIPENKNSAASNIDNNEAMEHQNALEQFATKNNCAYIPVGNVYSNPGASQTAIQAFEFTATQVFNDRTAKYLNNNPDGKANKKLQDKLNEYISKIDTNNSPEGKFGNSAQMPFKSTWFLTRQKASREKNYNLAKKILAELEAAALTHKPISEILDAHISSRIGHGFSEKSKMFNRHINSDFLNTAFSEAKTEVAANKSKLNPVGGR